MSENQAQEPKQAQTVVTSENLREFQLSKLGITPENNENAQEAQPKAEEQAPKAEETLKNDEEVVPEDGTVDGSRVVFRGKWVPKSDYGYRMHLKTEEVKREKSARETAEAELRKLKENATPEPKTSEGKPDPAKFTDAFEYAEALAEWKVKETIRVRDEETKAQREKESQQKIVDAWNVRLEKARIAIADFDDVLSNSPVKNTDFSAEVQAAMIESDVGPEILHYFASNPEVVEKLKGMTTTAALREVGKIEAKLEKPAEKATEKPASISKAPAPIAPIKGGNAGASLVNERGEFTGSPAEYREARRKGLIR